MKQLTTVLCIISFCLFTSDGIAQVDSLKKVLKSSKGHDRIELLNELAWQLSYDNGSKSLEYAKEALALSIELEDQEGKATSYARIGLVYDYEGRWDKALDNYQKSLKLRQKIGDSTPISNAWNNVGAVYQLTGKYEKAISAHINALRIREEIVARSKRDEDLKLVAQSLNNIAIIHRLTGNYTEAIKIYEQSLEIKRNLNDTSGEMITTSNLGVVYQSLENYEAALSFFKRAYELAEKYQETDHMGHCLNNMGLTYMSLEQYNLAEQKFNKALELAKKHNERLQIATSYMNISTLYFAEAKLQESINFAEMTLSLADSIDFVEGKKSALLQLTASHEALGHFSLALRFHREYTLLKDSILNKSNSEKILELSAKYDAERKESKIDMLSAQGDVDRSKLAQRNALSIALGVGFILVCTISFFTIRNYRARKVLAEERAMQEVEKHQKEIDLLRANIQNQLDKSQKFEVGIPKEALNLYLLNPLSDRELDVMYLLADGKSNKEIGEELFVSVNTIKTHVLKIYEKLDVQNRTQAAVKAGTMNILKQ